MAELAVALALINQGGKTLLGKRASSAHAGGKFEFIGGKVEAGETPQVALARECVEELGVSVSEVKTACKLRFSYPDRSVRLHVFWAKLDEENPRPLGTESLQWVDLSQLNQLPMPAANTVIKKVAELPKTYCITPDLAHEAAKKEQKSKGNLNPNQHEASELDQWLKDRLSLPINSLVYVRLKNQSLDCYVWLYEQLARRRPDLKLVCEYRAWSRLSSLCFAAHISSRELASTDQLPQSPESNVLWFASVHSKDQIAQANQLGVHAVTLSPIKTTPTHPEATTLGWQRAKQLAELCQCTVYALGGLRPEDLEHCAGGNFYGVAGIRHFNQNLRNDA